MIRSITHKPPYIFLKTATIPTYYGISIAIPRYIAIIILHEFIPLHDVILLKALLCSYELNTLDACWIAVDVWSNSSRCRQESVYLSRT